MIVEHSSKCPASSETSVITSVIKSGRSDNNVKMNGEKDLNLLHIFGEDGERRLEAKA
jgi:hypothetical protein